MNHKFSAMGEHNSFCSNGEDKSVDMSPYKKILVICTPSRFPDMIRNLGGFNSGKQFRLYTNWYRDSNTKWDCIVVDSQLQDYYEFAMSVYGRMWKVTKQVFLHKGENYYVKLNFRKNG